MEPNGETYGQAACLSPGPHCQATGSAPELAALPATPTSAQLVPIVNDILNTVGLEKGENSSTDRFQKPSFPI